MPIFFAAPIEQYPWFDKVTTTPTYTPADSAYPASNLLLMDPTRPAKAISENSSVVWDFGAVKTFDVVSLLYTNLTYESWWGVEISNDNVAWTTLLNPAPGTTRALANYTASQTVNKGKSGMLLRNATLYNSPTVLSARYLRVTIGTAVANLMPSIGRLFVGTKYVPSTGWQYGSSYEFIDNSRRERTDRGALVVDVLDPIRVANVKMDFLNKAEMNDFIQDFSYWRGSAREILACLDTVDVANMQRNLFYANITEGRRVSFDSYNTHSVTWTLESIGAG